MISIDGSNNIVIKDIYESVITVNYNDFDAIKEHIEIISNKILDASKEELKSSLQLALQDLKKFQNRVIFPEALSRLPYISDSDVFGREKDLEELVKLLKHEDKIVLLNGIGGIGKTTLAKILINKQKKSFNHVCWVEIIDNVKEAFVFNIELIDSLGLSNELEKINRGKDFVNIAFDYILNRLRQLRGINLLIIDNASIDIEDLEILDKIALRPYWKVLVTSRQHLEGFKVYELQALEEKDALNLFYHHYKYEQNDEIVNEILELISYHTLSIEIIAKTGEKRILKLLELLNIVKKKVSNISEASKGIKVLRNKNRPITDYATFLASIFPIAQMSQFEKWVLYQFAVMPAVHIKYRNSKNGMNLPKILNISPEILDEKFPDSLNNLVELGWIKRYDYGFIVHNIVQEVVLIQEGNQIEYCKGLILFLGNELDKAFIKDKVSGLPMLQFVDRLCDIFDVTDYHDLGNLYNNASVIYEDALGNYQKSLFFNNKSVKIHLKTGNEFELSTSYNSLATTYRLLGNLDQALDYGLRALEIREKYKDIKLAYLGNTYQTISIIYRNKNMIPDSLKYAQKAIQIRETLSEAPEKDKRIAKLYNNISIIYRTAKDYDKAILFGKKSMDIKEKYYPEDKISLSNSFATLAITYLQAGMIEEGHKFAKEDLKISKEVLNPNHPFLAISYNTLALINFHLNDLSKALSYSEKEIAIMQSNFNQDHPDFKKATELNNKILKGLEQSTESI